jgi:hypothetical protein
VPVGGARQARKCCAIDLTISCRIFAKFVSTVARSAGSCELTMRIPCVRQSMSFGERPSDG